MLLLADGIDNVPPETLKYILLVLGWLATTGAAIYGGAKWSAKGTKESPVNIEQPLDVRRHDAAVRKSELTTVEVALTKVTERVDALAVAINAQFTAMAQAGQDRAAAITQNIDEEIGAVQHKIGVLADALHEKINAAVIDNARQSSDISHLQAETFRHTGEITRIQSAIQDLLKRPLRSK